MLLCSGHPLYGILIQMGNPKQHFSIIVTYIWESSYFFCYSKWILVHIKAFRNLIDESATLKCSIYHYNNHFIIGTVPHLLHRLDYCILNILQGLESSWMNHRQCADMLHEGLENLGLAFVVPEKVRRKGQASDLKSSANSFFNNKWLNFTT